MNKHLRVGITLYTNVSKRGIFVSRKVKFEVFFAWPLIFLQAKAMKIIFEYLKNLFTLICGFWFPGSEFRVAQPRALNTFLDGLAELGVDKRLIINKQILSNLLGKEKVYRENGEGEGNDDSDRNDSSDGEESQSESNDEESDNKSDQEGIIEKESTKPCHHCQSRNMSLTAVV